MSYYEVIVKVGPTVIDHPNGKQGLAWDSVKTHHYMTLDAARNRRDEERRKNRDAIVSIRDATTMEQCG